METHVHLRYVPVMTSRLPGDRRLVAAAGSCGLEGSAGSGVCLYLLPVRLNGRQ